MTKEDLIKLQDKLLQSQLLRLKGFYKTQKKDLSLKEFIIKFFQSFNNEFDTIDKETKEVQTPKGRRRSLGDLFLICRYYYKDCELKKVLQIILIDLVNDTSIKFRTSYCYQMQKRAFYIGSSSGIYNEDQMDEFGYKFYDYVNMLKEK